MFPLSIGTYIKIGAGVIAIGLIAWIWITLSNRAAEIARLNDQLAIANTETQKAVDDANQNALKVIELTAANVAANAASALKVKDDQNVAEQKIGVVEFIAAQPKSVACSKSAVIGGSIAKLYGADSDAGGKTNPDQLSGHSGQSADMPGAATSAVAH